MYDQIDQDKAKQMIAAGSLSIIDTRDPGSFAANHIESAQNVTAENVDGFCQSADKAMPVIVYCYKGIGSQSVAKYLDDQGFDAYSLIGGFDEWKCE